MSAAGAIRMMPWTRAASSPSARNSSMASQPPMLEPITMRGPFVMLRNIWSGFGKPFRDRAFGENAFRPAVARIIEAQAWSLHLAWRRVAKASALLPVMSDLNPPSQKKPQRVAIIGRAVLKIGKRQAGRRGVKSGSRIQAPMTTRSRRNCAIGLFRRTIRRPASWPA